MRNAIVIGGGIAGMSAAIMLKRAGIEVNLIDLDPDWKMAGAGFTISAPTLRAFRQIGILDEVAARGHTHAGVRACDVAGRPLCELGSPAPAGEALPGAGGILRPVLHAILLARVRELGVPVRLGLSAASSAKAGARCAVQLSDGTAEEYDLVVGADGLLSGMRAQLFPEAVKPVFPGQACWRLLIPRPPQIDRRHFFLGGAVKVGLTPVSVQQMYMFLLEHVPGNPRRVPQTQHHVLRRLLAGFGGILANVREELCAVSQIVYRPLEPHLLRHDWWRANTILIGDAAHACTPQLASGAGMAAEDGIVLAEELQRGANLSEVFAGFMRRRFERCRLVVDNSLAIGRLEVAGASAAEQTAIVERSLRALAAPI